MLDAVKKSGGCWRRTQNTPYLFDTSHRWRYCNVISDLPSRSKQPAKVDTEDDHEPSSFRRGTLNQVIASTHESAKMAEPRVRNNTETRQGPAKDEFILPRTAKQKNTRQLPNNKSISYHSLYSHVTCLLGYDRGGSTLRRECSRTERNLYVSVTDRLSSEVFGTHTILVVTGISPKTRILYKIW